MSMQTNATKQAFCRTTARAQANFQLFGLHFRNKMEGMKQLNLMLELLFSVRAKVAAGEKIKVVGSTIDLGSWNPQHALCLISRKEVWEGSLFDVSPDTKLEFKLIKIKANGDIEWQQLPNNSNRKFRPKFSTQLHLQWNQPAGRINSISNDSFKLKGLPAVMLKKSKEFKVKVKVSEEFDPYSKAHDQQSQQENQEQFLLVRKKMNQQININNKDLEQIYYKSSSVQILAGLLKKVKIYVVSKDLDNLGELHHKLEEELNRLPANYMARWITQDCINQSQPQRMSSNMKRMGSLFEIGPQELYLQSLYSLTSYFMILDLEVAFVLTKILSKVSCCLYLPSQKYAQVISNLPKLAYVDLICFDTVQANRAFYQYLKSKETEVNNQQSQLEILSLQTPSVQSIVHELQKLKHRESQVFNTLEHICLLELTEILARPNNVFVIDATIVEENKCLWEVIGKMKLNKSMMIIVCDDVIPPKLLQKMEDRNHIFVYDDFEKIRLERRDYFPLRSFRETIDHVKMKSRIFKETYGGEIVERQNSLMYFLPEDKNDIALKIQLQCKKVVSKFGFVKVSRKGTRVKVSWNLSKEARLMRTLCELKYVNMGVLGDFNLITSKMNFRQLRQQTKLLFELLPKLFVDGKETKVHEYELGNHPSEFSKIEIERKPSQTDEI